MGAPGGLRNIGSPDRELQEPAPRVRPGAEGPGPRAGPGAGGHRVRGEEARTPHALQKSLRSQSPSVQLHTRCLAHTRGPSIHPPHHRPRRLLSAWGPAAAAPQPPARCAWPRGCSPPMGGRSLEFPAGVTDDNVPKQLLFRSLREKPAVKVMLLNVLQLYVWIRVCQTIPYTS